MAPMVGAGRRTEVRGTAAAAANSMSSYSDDRQPVRHADTRRIHRLEHAEREQVVGAEDGGGPVRAGQAEQPGARVAARRHVEAAGGDLRERAGLQARLGECRAGGVAAVLDLLEPDGAADERDVAVARVDEMAYASAPPVTSSTETEHPVQPLGDAVDEVEGCRGGGSPRRCGRWHRQA